MEGTSKKQVLLKVAALIVGMMPVVVASVLVFGGTWQPGRTPGIDLLCFGMAVLFTTISLYLMHCSAVIDEEEMAREARSLQETRHSEMAAGRIKPCPVCRRDVDFYEYLLHAMRAGTGMDYFDMFNAWNDDRVQVPCCYCEALLRGSSFPGVQDEIPSLIAGKVSKETTPAFLRHARKMKIAIIKDEQGMSRADYSKARALQECTCCWKACLPMDIDRKGRCKACRQTGAFK